MHNWEAQKQFAPSLSCSKSEHSNLALNLLTGKLFFRFTTNIAFYYMKQMEH